MKSVNIKNLPLSLSLSLSLLPQIGERQKVLVTEESFDAQYFVAHNKFYEQVKSRRRHISRTTVGRLASRYLNVNHMSVLSNKHRRQTGNSFQRAPRAIQHSERPRPNPLDTVTLSLIGKSTALRVKGLSLFAVCFGGSGGGGGVLPHLFSGKREEILCGARRTLAPAGGRTAGPPPSEAGEQECVVLWGRVGTWGHTQDRFWREITAVFLIYIYIYR
jgi:hypothetical protein